MTTLTLISEWLSVKLQSNEIWEASTEGCSFPFVSILTLFHQAPESKKHLEQEEFASILLSTHMKNNYHLMFTLKNMCSDTQQPF